MSSYLEIGSNGTLHVGEYHPAADSAMKFFKSLSIGERAKIEEAFASTALSGNRLSEICLDTMQRLKHGKPVSDRYLLGLCWVIQDINVEKVFEKETVEEGEYDPIIDFAMKYWRELPIDLKEKIEERVAADALYGDRVSQIIIGTMRRLRNGEPVSDKYLLGLMFMIVWARLEVKS